MKRDLKKFFWKVKTNRFDWEDRLKMRDRAVLICCLDSEIEKVRWETKNGKSLLKDYLKDLEALKRKINWNRAIEDEKRWHEVERDFKLRKIKGYPKKAYYYLRTKYRLLTSEYKKFCYVCNRRLPPFEKGVFCSVKCEKQYLTVDGETLPPEVRSLYKEYLEGRKKRKSNLEKADRMKESIEDMGFEVRDTKDGTKVRKKIS